MTGTAIAKIGVNHSADKKSRAFRELNTIITVMAREITVALKSPANLIMSLAMPLVMMGMIGGNLMQNMAGGLGFQFGTFMLVGMLVNMLFMTTTMGMSSLVDDHDIDFNQEMLVSPVSRYSLVIGKILGGSFTAIISMFGTLIVGLIMGISITVPQLLAILALSPLMCLSGGALAMIVIGVIKNKKAANMATMLITMPQMFLSGDHTHSPLHRHTDGPQPLHADDLLPRPGPRGGVRRQPAIRQRGDVQPDCELRSDHNADRGMSAYRDDAVCEDGKEQIAEIRKQKPASLKRGRPIFFCFGPLSEKSPPAADGSCNAAAFSSFPYHAAIKSSTSSLNWHGERCSRLNFFAISTTFLPL